MTSSSRERTPRPTRAGARSGAPGHHGAAHPGARAAGAPHGGPSGGAPAPPGPTLVETGATGASGPGHGPGHDVFLDGLFTYCLSVMCEHAAAQAALGEALALADRRDQEGKAPDDPALRRAWLYALARWSCLRGLEERRRTETSTADGSAQGPEQTARRAGGSGQPLPAPRVAGGAGAEQRRRELAALAWPEAAGAPPAQREALELAVRHQLGADEVARVLRHTPEETRALLASAAREVERARGALAAVRAGSCPAVAALAGADQLLMAPGLRRELMRHVDDCPSCRLSSQSAQAATASTGATPRLAVLPAPREAVHAARLVAARARARHTPRFDRSGFPLPERDRAARRERLRSRARTATVVATVIAAPALALWAVFRDAPLTGEATRGGAPAAADDDRNGEGYYDHPYENTGSADASEPDGHGDPAGPEGAPEPGDEDAAEDDDPAEDAAEDDKDGAADASPSDDGSASPGTGRLRVEAHPAEGGTRITLTAAGDAPVQWRASSNASWLKLSHSSGTVRPGEPVTLWAVVDAAAEPQGAWSARVTFEPSGAAVTVEGRGGGGSPEPPPSGPDPTEPEPDPADPGGEPEEPEPDPADPGGEPEPGPRAASAPSAVTER